MRIVSLTTHRPTVPADGRRTVVVPQVGVARVDFGEKEL
jgi:hypothetical protein